MTTQPPPAAEALTLEDRREAVGALVDLLDLGGRLAFELQHGNEWADFRRRLGLPGTIGRPGPYELLNEWESSRQAVYECAGDSAFDVLALLLQPDDDSQAAAAADLGGSNHGNPTPNP